MVCRMSSRALLLLLLALVAAAPTAGEKRMPKILWAQRRHLLYLRVVIPGLDKSSLHVMVNDTHVAVSGKSAEDGVQYAMRAHLFRKIEPAGCSWEVNDLGEIQFILQKFWEWRYWPRLLHTYNAKSELQQQLQVDWKRWKPEFDEGTNDEDSDIMMPGEDSDWLDDELALKKPATFVEEQFNRTHLALLNATTLRPFLKMEGKPQQLAVVLFFDRSYSKKSNTMHQLVRLFAATAGVVNKKVSVALVDGKADQQLMKKMRITQFPTAKLFFPNGDMFDFNPTEVKNVKNFAMFLFKQMNPAWVEMHDVDMVARVFTQAPRVVLGIFDEEEKLQVQTQSDLVAKSYRAMPETPPVLFARMNTTLLPDLYDAGARNHTIADIMDRIKLRDLVTESYRGIVMVKDKEEPQKYDGPIKKDPMVGWVYAKHFNALEAITRTNFNEFRRRRIPVMYILLDDETEKHEPLLDSILPLAQEFFGKVSFVYTPVSTAGDLMEHLRCEYSGVTFAVMEDFIDEYRYCADATPTKPLTVERLRRLAEGVLANSIKPDKVASDKVPDPKDNQGPVYEVVADNLIETVMQADYDVVIHFYATFDEKWDEDEFELQKLGEAVEDEKKLKIARINGITNEKPSEFPEIGYIPCTWMFPANSKHTPIYFNKTMGGFNAYSLLRWVKENGSHPVDVPDFANPNPFAEGLPDESSDAAPAKDKASPDDDQQHAAGDKPSSKDDGKPAPARQKPNPKNKARTKIDDVMKELNDLRKGMKKDEL